MRPDGLLALAVSLAAADRADEAAFRGAAHAAYYAVYHLMAQHFALDTAIRDEAHHAEVMRRLDRIDLKTAPAHVRAARRVYKSLWELRRKADYDLKTPFDDVLAERAVEYAQRVFCAMR